MRSSLLLIVAGVLARRTMTQMADAIGTTLDGVQAEAQQSASSRPTSSQTLEAASRYVETRDSTALDAVPPLRLDRRTTFSVP